MNNDRKNTPDNGIGLKWRFTSYIELVIQHAKIDYLRKLSYRKKEVLVEKVPDYVLIEKQDSIQLEMKNGFVFEEEWLSRAFSQLPLLRQKILELIFIEGLSASETAKKLNCSVNYVYKQKHLALKKMRDFLLSGGNRHDQ